VILTFGEFALDIDRFELRRNGQPRKVEPKVFDLVIHFAKNPGKCVLAMISLRPYGTAAWCQTQRFRLVSRARARRSATVAIRNAT